MIILGRCCFNITLCYRGLERFCLFFAIKVHGPFVSQTCKKFPYCVPSSIFLSPVWFLFPLFPNHTKAPPQQSLGAAHTPRSPSVAVCALPSPCHWLAFAVSAARLVQRNLGLCSQAPCCVAVVLPSGRHSNPAHTHGHSTLLYIEKN